MVSLDNLGAWLLKANGNTSDIAEVAARREPIPHWCVQPSYRTDLMAAGQPLLFWVSGRRHPGVWATGELTGPASWDLVPHQRKLRVPLRLRWLDEHHRIPRPALLADPELAALEVLRQPQAANPSFVTKSQLAAVQQRHS
ncbi:MULTISPECIES: hypothetical protein [Dactylosporangium]|nr:MULTISPECIES: hypothetical protein [Dactylosporangium]UAC02008.1 hypothetical protein Dvina_32220 [Dactylosporangium vinaceum]UWZ49789.1 hypothetical protein Dmats_27290 [Dactylosporangium matsuzakiense]